MINTEARLAMLAYLQDQLNAFKESEEKFGMDRESERRFDAMIACKEMVEVLIEEPVNLGKDGKVTVGF